MIHARVAIGLVAVGLLVGATVSGQQAKGPASQSKGPATQPKAAAPAKGSDAPVLVFDFLNKGTVEIEMFPAESPKSVDKVLGLVRSGFYNGLRVHWVQPGVVQFGDPLTKNMAKSAEWGNGSTGKSVGVAETSKRKFERGIVGMYYRVDFGPKSADSQIFILRAPNPVLNGKYPVLGRVVTGMNVVDKLEVPDRIVKAYVKGEKPR